MTSSLGGGGEGGNVPLQIMTSLGGGEFFRIFVDAKGRRLGFLQRLQCVTNLL